ncbi:MAG: ATP synthase subunit I, partial [Nitrospinaceae bacterium]|nr:ATP synthase subunit I [Nitrospinaceae bacterium]
MSENNGLRQGMQIAFKLGTELTVATLIGALMGYGIDNLLGTRPWG